MNLRELRRSCAARVGALDLPSPFAVRTFCASLERTRRRPLHVIPRAFPAGGPSGGCVSTGTSDYIFYESHTSVLHQDHIILHEVAHLLCEHQPVVSHDEIERLLFPDLDPKVIERVLGRTCDASWPEQEAELIASLILARATRHPDDVVRAAAGAVTPFAARAAWSLGHR